MEWDKTHAVQNAFLNAQHAVFGNIVMPGVPPVEQDICAIQERLSKALFTVVEGGSADFQLWIGTQRLRQGSVNSLRIDVLDMRILALMHELVPDRDLNRFCPHIASNLRA